MPSLIGLNSPLVLPVSSTRRYLYTIYKSSHLSVFFLGSLTAGAPSIFHYTPYLFYFFCSLQKCFMAPLQYPFDKRGTRAVLQHWSPQHPTQRLNQLPSPTRYVIISMRNNTLKDALRTEDAIPQDLSKPLHGTCLRSGRGREK